MRSFLAIPGASRSRHQVCVLAFDDVVAFDLAIPCEIFGRARLADGARPYAVEVCARSATVRSGHFAIGAPFGLDALATADTVVVPGIEEGASPPDPEILAALKTAAARGARIASICSGAFILAAAGLLDGRRATTHWLAASALASRYPRVSVDPDVLFVEDGPIFTSAGAAAGLDLCLHLVRRDHGAAVAAEAARAAVMPLERDGGQAQFASRPPPASHASLAPLLDWMAEHCHEAQTFASLAGRAGASPRTFGRRFRAQTGTTPLQWLLLARIRRAQALLERTDLVVERVATETGFASAATFRERFARIVGVSPTAYRRAFGAHRPDSRRTGSGLRDPRVEPM